MSSFTPTGRDLETLPNELLDLAKVHMRVAFDRDDEYIKLCLQRAIELFERYSGQVIFASNFAWIPYTGQGNPPITAQTPVQPIASFTAISGGVDVAADYQIASGAAMTAPVYLVRVDGAALAADLVTTLVAGYAAAADLPPTVKDIVLRSAATLYEYRETVTTPIQQIPFWFNDLLVATWIPRC